MKNPIASKIHRQNNNYIVLIGKDSLGSVDYKNFKFIG